MESFPFTKREWRAVREAAREVAEAAQGAMPSRRAARWSDLRTILASLRARHGEHPALLETEADFAPDSPAAISLYRRAEGLAAEHGLPTLSIRLSLARILLEELGQPDAARVALLACQQEVSAAPPASGVVWEALLTECDRQNPGLHDTPAPGPMATPVPAPAGPAVTLRTPGHVRALERAT